MQKVKTRAGEPREAFVRAIYAEMLLDKAESMIAKINPTYLDITDIENPHHKGDGSMSPSAWNLHCYQNSPEQEIIQRDLFNKLSEEAKAVLKIFLTTPTEVTEALMRLSVNGETRRPDRENHRVSTKRLYKPARVKRYLRQFFAPPKITGIFRELNLFFTENRL
jgi:hypothetical protein